MRLIDADKLKAAFRREIPGLCDRFEVNFVVNMQPTVDAVPVVRCKACTFRGSDVCMYWYAEENEESDEFFCAFGERENNETH